MGHSNCRNSPHPALKRKCVCCLTHALYGCLHQSESCIWNARSLTKLSEIPITRECLIYIRRRALLLLRGLQKYLPWGSNCSVYRSFICSVYYFCLLFPVIQPSQSKKKKKTLGYEHVIFFFFLNVLWTFINYDFVLMFWEIIKEQIDNFNKHFINVC